MSKFKELNQYIFDIENLLLKNQKLCKLLYYPHKDALEKGDIKDTDILINNNIFPFNYIPTDDEQKCIISIILDDFRNDGSVHLRKGTISFNIICHKDLWATDLGLRPFLLMEEIDTIFNKVHNRQAVKSLGGLVFQDAHALWNSNIYSGYQLIYECENIV
ncbi:hypothetical protein [Clostridium brassicae]|uniref:Uncharacterized protein n=1 Tax=Clostridium brassicae TaxID=2999072 RepID=A0ABT4D7J6_9CLOT|nr:hypothetical protein [Clostridium brassicae]MCY6958275.1 hypothetical protein [Clostridium brassicae]